MIDILQFIFQDFWHWLGAFMLLMVFRPLAGISRHAGWRLIDDDAVKAVTKYLAERDKSAFEKAKKQIMGEL